MANRGASVRAERGDWTIPPGILPAAMAAELDVLVDYFDLVGKDGTNAHDRESVLETLVHAAYTRAHLAPARACKEGGAK